jgi:2-haloacid dehalogenase
VPRVCVFDVNETLLDLAALDPIFERAFGDRSVRPLWFAQMLQSALVATLTGAYADFGRAQMAALDMLAARRGVEVSEEDRSAVREGMKRLPPHPDVREGLERLREAGLRLATLTNSTRDVAEAQLAHAGIRDLFEEALSADEVKRLKPAPEPYRMAAERLGVPISQVRLVAAHAWDVAGARQAGCATAFIARPGMVLDPLFEEPDVVGPDLRAVATGILEREGVAVGP